MTKLMRQTNAILIISCDTNGNKKSIIKTLKALDIENTSVTDHVVEIIKKKFDIEVPKHDIQACHHLPNRQNPDQPKAILIRFLNRKPGSAWNHLVNKILSGGGDKNVNLFLNFQLTLRRNNLLFQLRKMKKEKKYVSYTATKTDRSAIKKVKILSKRS